MKNVLTIAGSDCSGGAGIQADLKTFSAHGVFGMSVIVSIVAENTARVLDIENVSPAMIKKQIDAVFEDINVNAVKVGMLSDREHMLAVAEKLCEYKPQNVVIDPVMYAKNGAALMAPNAIDTLIENIVPLADLLTPNLFEAEAIVGFKVENKDDMLKASENILKQGAKNVLIKGGHLQGEHVDDLLYSKDGFKWFEGERINTKNTHGTGCTLSSSLAANLAKGMTLEEAVLASKKYITFAIKHSLNIGKGHGPTNHFAEIYQKMGWL